MTAVDLIPSWKIDDLDLTSYPYGVDANSSVDIGEPEMVVENVVTGIADGDQERVVRHGNRTYVIPIYIEGASLGELAESEAKLRLALKRPGAVLTHDAGDGLTPASVYEISTARLTHRRDDKHEMHLMRAFEVTLTCSPWARSATLTTYPALETAASTPTVIDDCSSATGWTATVDGVSSAPAVTSGSLTASDSTDPKVVQLSRSATVAFGSQRYLIVEARTNSVQMAAYGMVAGSARNLPMQSSRLLTSGWLQFVYDTAGATVDGFTLVVAGQVYGSAKAPTTLIVDQVSKSATPPQTSARQLSRVIVSGGTERTPASIHVSTTNPAVGAGLTIVHTSPETSTGYSPPLRRWRISGNGTPSSGTDTFSGAFEPIHPAAAVFEVPVSAIPAGEYVLCAALKTDTAATHQISWAAQTRLPSSPTAQALYGGSTPVVFYTNTDWHFAALTPLTLPTMRGSNGAFVRIGIQYQGTPGPTIILDDAWLFRVGDDCALTVVNSVPQHLWIDSPGVSSGSSEALVSTLTDRTDQWHPGESLLSTGSHYLSPGGTALFTATRGFDNSQSEASCYDRYHSNAAS